MIQIPQSTARVVMLKVFDTGTTTAATGKTVAITISKAGGAFGNPNAGATTATEVSVGWYKVTLDTTDTGTTGDLVVRGTATGCDATERIFGVVKATNGGLTGIPDAAADAAGGLPISDAGGLDLDAKLANTNEVTAARMGALTDWIDGGRLDLILDARASQASVDDVPTVAEFEARTVTSATYATAANLATVAGYLDTEVAAIKAKTDNLPAAPAAVGDIPTAAANAAAVLAAGDVDGYTLEQTLKLCLAALAGKLSGAATTTVTIRSADDTANRLVATVDADGNRSAVTINAAG